jgi:hypothetical protein
MSNFKFEYQYYSIFKSFKSLAAQTVRPDIVYIVGTYDDRLNIKKLKSILGDIELKCFKNSKIDIMCHVFKIMKYLRDTDNISFITPEDVFIPYKIEIVTDLLKTNDIVEHSYCAYGDINSEKHYENIVIDNDKSLIDSYYNIISNRSDDLPIYFLYSLRGIVLKTILTILNDTYPHMLQYCHVSFTIIMTSDCLFYKITNTSKFKRIHDLLMSVRNRSVWF